MARTTNCQSTVDLHTPSRHVWNWKFKLPDTLAAILLFLEKMAQKPADDDDLYMNDDEARPHLEPKDVGFADLDIGDDE